MHPARAATAHRTSRSAAAKHLPKGAPSPTASVYDFALRLITDDWLYLNAFRGRVLLVVNIASFCHLAKRELAQLNQLTFKFGSQLAIVAVPCNQFGNKENGNGVEIINTLRDVRPGGGFVAHFALTVKMNVNGDAEHPLFSFLKDRLQVPCDDSTTFMPEGSTISWQPVRRNDIGWNFEKFLISPDGAPYKRYSSNFQSAHLAHDIAQLIHKFANENAAAGAS